MTTTPRRNQSKLSVDVEDLSPLVGGGRPQPRQDVIFLPLGRLIALCLGAMAIGATIPTLLMKNSTVDIESKPDESKGHLVPQDFITKKSLRQGGNNNNASHPKIAWLMSFPNSGTSYTMNLVTAASNMTQGSNYGWEHKNTTNETVPIFDKGPFWLQPTETRPTSVVLTKTHCGGYCHDCRPRKSVESPHSFLMHCSQSDDLINVTENWHEKHVYDYKTMVDRAVHLIRDPLDNMVSRYHLGLHKLERENRTDARYTPTQEGFTTFCQDRLREGDERSDSHVDQQALRMIADVPCHLDLFRYVQWHNLAFIATRDFLGIDTHVLHYEDYNNNFDETLTALLNFLDLPNTGAVWDFEAGKSYRDYYTEDQIARMKNATRRLASPITWQHLERYFE